MQLSARFLNDVSSANSFEHVSQLEISGGDAQTIFFQLVDPTLDRTEQGFSPSGRRYMPPALSTLQVTLWNLDDSKKVIRTATQPYPLDPSIWSFQILASDPIKGTVGVNLVLSEPTRTLTSPRFSPTILRVW